MSIWLWLVIAWFAWRVAAVPLLVAGGSVALDKATWAKRDRKLVKQYWLNVAAEALLLLLLIFAGFFA